MTYVSRLDLSDSVRKEVVTVLHARLVDAIDLEAQLKLAHWNVKGGQFYQLHLLFDQMHAVVEEFVDTLAERIVALGARADGRISTVAQSSTLPAYPVDASDGQDHLEAIARALATFGHAVREAIDAAAGLGEQGTADLFTGMSRETDKQLWFVEAHLVGRGRENAP